MNLFGRKHTEPITVSFNVRVFIDNRMVRVDLNAEGRQGERFRDFLKRLGKEGALDPLIVRFILGGAKSVTVLRNGKRLSMPAAGKEVLTDGDEVSVLTPVAGG
jgi:molybdopterin converting factor small subunit